jgi:hypothetical protein
VKRNMKPNTSNHDEPHRQRPSEIEYEIGNKPDSLNDDEDDSDVSSSNQGARVVMMYDDDGNAVPMPMDRFYYDNVRGEGADAEEERAFIDDEETHHSDTERFNKPAALNMNESLDSESDEPAEKSESSTGSQENDNDEGTDDQDGGQFMRIQVAASSIKTVDRVVKDNSHDKVPKRTRSVTVGGMVRAISNVHQNANDADRKRQPAKPQESTSVGLKGNSKENVPISQSSSKQVTGRKALLAVGRMLSLSKEKKPVDTAQIEKHSNNGKLPDAESTNSSQSRQRDVLTSSKGYNNTPKRQNITSVGRMLSFSKKSTTSSEKPFDHQMLQPGVGSAENEKRSDDNFDQGRKSSSSYKASSLVLVDGIATAQNNVPVSNLAKKKLDSLSDDTKSRNSRTIVEENLLQPNQGSPADRERRETERQMPVSSARMGIKKVGRILSMSKKSTQVPPVSSTAGEGESVPNLESGSSKDLKERENGIGASVSKKNGSRMGIASAGRLLSFSRKPDKINMERVIPSTVLQEATPAASPGSASALLAPAKSPRLDGRANRFFFSEINSDCIKCSSGLANESHIRVPVLVMAEYSGPVSKTKWFIDAFTLPHNAVRRECIDLYDILMALARCRGDLDITRDDMRDFHSWWVIAQRFFKCYFEMERTVLFPWVDGAGSKDWELQMALNKMRSMKDGLQEQLEGINDSWRNLESKSPGELFAQVYRGVDTFCPRIMNYFADQELLLPAIVKGVYTIDDRLRMDKDMLECFMDEPLSRKNKDSAHHNIVLLIRWIANPRQLRAWISKNLNSTGRAAYNKWQALYETDHARIVKMFRNRSRMNAMAAITNPVA